MNSTSETPTQRVTSADGTEIAYEAHGSGPALVLVDGAMCHRSLGPSRNLTQQLSGAFTVYAYDRRGRGDSGPGASPYTAEREIEDLLAVVQASGGHAHVFGSSSGATLALEAARRGAPFARLAVYESPFIVDETRPANDPQLPEKVSAMVAEGRRSQAVQAFLHTVGAPAPAIFMMRWLPSWKQLTAVAHTLPYDLSLVVPHQQGQPLPAGYYAEVHAPTLVLAGSKSPTYMRNAQAAIAAAIPDADLHLLPRQTHMIKAKVVAPVLTDFLSTPSHRAAN